MSNNSVRFGNSPDKRLIDTLARLDKDFVQSLKVVTSDSQLVFTGLGGGAGTTNPSVPTANGNFLQVAGGAMQGAIAFTPRIAHVVNNRFSVDRDVGVYTSYMILNYPTNTELHAIDGAHDDGQRIILQGIATELLIIKNDPSGIGSDYNIRTPGGVDFKLVGNATVALYFDPINNQWAFEDEAIFDNVTPGDPSTWSHYPATQTVDFAHNILQNVHTIYQTLFGSPEINFGSNFIQFIANGTSSHLDFYTHGGVEGMEIDETQIQMLEQVNFNGFDIVGISDIQWQFGDKIFDHSGVGFEHFVQGSQTHHKFQYSTTLLLDINTNEVDIFENVFMHSNGISQINSLGFVHAGKIISDGLVDNSELAYIAGSSQKHSFFLAGGSRVADFTRELDQFSNTVRVLLMDSSSYIDFNNNSLSAVGGTITPPTKVLGYVIAMVGGNKVKIPYYGF